MADPIPLNLGVKSNPSRYSLQAGGARLINAFSQELGQEGKSQFLIVGTPGLANFGTALAGGGIRNMIEVGGFLYVVAGPILHKIGATGDATELGSVPTTGPVYSRVNRHVPPQIAYLSDGYYAVCVSDVITQIDDPDLPNPLFLSFLDGYGIIPISGGDFMITGLDDFTTIDALDEGNVEAKPGEITGSFELGRENFFFKIDDMEAFQNTGDADFPLERNQAVELGCLIATSIASVDAPAGRTLIWVAPNHTVQLLNGYSGTVISNDEVSDLLRKLHEAGNISDLRSTAWAWGGNFFYQLSCSDWTRTFDAASGYWHDRKSYLSERSRISQVIRFGNKLIAGDADTGQLYQVSRDYFDEAGNPLVMQIVTSPVHMFPYRGRMNGLFLDAATGVGLLNDTDSNENPQILIEWSKDGGKTFPYRRVRYLGRKAKDAHRITPIRRLGRFGHKGLVFRLTIDASVQRLVLAAAMDAEKLQP